MSYTSGKFFKHAQKVLKDDIDGISKNTRLAYDSKAREFLGFCKCVYGNIESYTGHTPIHETESSQYKQKKQSHEPLHETFSFRHDIETELL